MVKASGDKTLFYPDMRIIKDTTGKYKPYNLLFYRKAVCWIIELK